MKTTVLAAWYANHPTVEELRRILGPSWAICRNTAKNRERYQNIISRKQYEQACAQALSSRVQS